MKKDISLLVRRFPATNETVVTFKFTDSALLEAATNPVDRNTIEACDNENTPISQILSAMAMVALRNGK